MPTGITEKEMCQKILNNKYFIQAIKSLLQINSYNRQDRINEVIKTFVSNIQNGDANNKSFLDLFAKFKTSQSSDSASKAGLSVSDQFDDFLSSQDFKLAVFGAINSWGGNGKLRNLMENNFSEDFAEIQEILSRQKHEKSKIHVNKR